jgi:hypothetical protein
VSELHVAVAGCPFAITPAEELSREERAALTRLSSELTSDRLFTIRLDDTLPMGVPEDGEPAAITADGDHVYIAHAQFAAVIDPLAYEARLHRRSNSFAIEATLRTALGCRLPLESGLLLHSAGIVIDGGAYLFYGVSGAGKSTIAGFMQHALSDELVAIQRGSARATGFWGTLDAADALAGTYPLRAAIELARGDDVSLQPLDAHDARKALLMVAVVPPHQQLWTHALPVIDSLARVPAFRLAWTPSAENAARVLTALRSEIP